MATVKSPNKPMPLKGAGARPAVTTATGPYKGAFSKVKAGPAVRPAVSIAKKPYLKTPQGNQSPNRKQTF